MSLTTVVAAVAAIPVTVNAVTPAVDSVAALRPSYSTADLPRRLILPFGDRASGASINAQTAGTSGTAAVWTVVDLLLWEAVGQTRGLRDVLPALMAYVDAYTTAVRGHIKLIRSPAAVIERVAYDIDLYTYGGDAQYWGVEVRLTVKELL